MKLNLSPWFNWKNRPGVFPIYAAGLSYFAKCAIMLFEPIYKNKDEEFIYFISPPPDLPARLSSSQAIKREESNFPTPRKELGIVDWWEGLREGDKMAFSFKL